MNRDEFQGNWKQLKGKIKEKWGKLTDDELSQINGRRETLIGKLQEKYGLAKEKAEAELSQFEKNVNLKSSRQQPGQVSAFEEEEVEEEASFEPAHQGTASSRGSQNASNKQRNPNGRSNPNERSNPNDRPSQGQNRPNNPNRPSSR